DSLDTRRSSQQIGEIEIPVTVRVHGLTEKHHLAKPRACRLLDLLEKSRKRQAALAAAYVGHDAERAELVAAPHRGHPGPHLAAARRREVGVGLLAAEAYLDRRVRRSLTVEDRRQSPVLVRTEHEIEERQPLEKPRSLMLRHATEN